MDSHTRTTFLLSFTRFAIPPSELSILRVTFDRHLDIDVTPNPTIGFSRPGPIDHQRDWRRERPRVRLAKR
jgi:hypothetical protein